jgi:flagellar biosynthesis protein FlhF
MQIHRVRGNDLKDALQRARRTHGEGAVVIGQETAPDGGITLAVAERPPIPSDQMRALREEGARKLGKVEPKNFPAEDALPKGYSEVCVRLESTGCSPAWSLRICQQAAESGDAADHPMDTVSAAIGSQTRIAKLPKAPGVTRVITFVGNTGVGKTTGLVKLGARLVRGKRNLGLATLDSRRVGAVEQLRAYADLLGSSLHVLKSDQGLTPEALGSIGKDVVLLDTSGKPSVDQPRLVKFHDELALGNRMTRLDAFLVLSATSSRAALREVTEAYGDVPLAGCVITKLDETRQPSHVLEHVIELGLPAAFLSDGQDIGRNFQRATPELLADLVLLGRLG